MDASTTGFVHSSYLDVMKDRCGTKLLSECADQEWILWREHVLWTRRRDDACVLYVPCSLCRVPMFSLHSPVAGARPAISCISRWHVLCRSASTQHLHVART